MIGLRNKTVIAWLSGVLLASCAAAPAQDLRPDILAFIAEMSAKHGFDSSELRRVLSQAEMRPEIIAAISKPAESKPWHQYRAIFVTPARIEAGSQFWQEHASELARAQIQYGVPAEIIVAILGVETRFGQSAGHYRVLDALTTLAFDYPPRSRYFRSELEQFLLLTREERMDPLSPIGSYAGAMGWAQFMPTSFRTFAVDFDGDGRRDLWNSPDAIGSIANYLAAHQWQPGAPVAVQVDVSGDKYEPLLKEGLKPRLTTQQLTSYGVVMRSPLRADPPGALIRLETESGPEYWIGFTNFYVITQYNRSPLYAMAVYQLGQAIRDRRAKEEST